MDEFGRRRKCPVAGPSLPRFLSGAAGMASTAEHTLTSSQRQMREWPLLVLALALVFALCTPLWQWSSGSEPGEAAWAKLTPERLGRLLLGPEQIACYCCFTCPRFILLGRYLEVGRQRRA